MKGNVYFLKVYIILISVECSLVYWRGKESSWLFINYKHVNYIEYIYTQMQWSYDYVCVVKVLLFGTRGFVSSLIFASRNSNHDKYFCHFLVLIGKCVKTMFFVFHSGAIWVHQYFLFFSYFFIHLKKNFLHWVKNYITKF